MSTRYEKSSRKGVSSAIVVAVLILGLVIGFSLGYALLLANQTVLNQRIEEWKNKFELAQNRIVELEYAYEKLRREYKFLEDKYEELKTSYEKSYQELKELEAQAEIFKQQVRELFYYRHFTLYNYKTRNYYHAWYKIRALDYYKYRFNVQAHVPARLEDRLTREILVEAVNSWRDPESSVIREIAYDLVQISGKDPELLANLALQIVHQIYYNVTDYTKYPLETLVEGSGDCDNVAVLLASILRAAEMDVIILLVETRSGAHAMVGVALPEPPNDLLEFGRDSYWYYEYNGKRYYLLEPTWVRLGEKWVDPASPQALRYIGSMVGDNPWGEELKIVDVVEAP